MGYRVGEALGRVPLLWSKLDLTIETDRHHSEMSALYPYLAEAPVWRATQDDKVFRDTKAPLPGTVCLDSNCGHEPKEGDLVCILSHDAHAPSSWSTEIRTMVVLRPLRFTDIGHGIENPNHWYVVIAFAECKPVIRKGELQFGKAELHHPSESSRCIRAWDGKMITSAF